MGNRNSSSKKQEFENELKGTIPLFRQIHLTKLIDANFAIQFQQKYVETKWTIFSFNKNMLLS